MGMVALATMLGLSLYKNQIYPMFVIGPLLLLVGLFLIIGFVGSWRRDFVALPLWVWSWLIGFVTFSWVSLYFSQTATIGLEEVLLDTAGVGLLLVLPYCWRKINRRLILLGLTGFGVVNGAWAMMQYFTRTELRVAGFFYQSDFLAHYYPNAFALSCLLLLPLAFYFLIQKSWWWTAWGALSSIIIGTGLVLSWSRGGWLGGIAIVVMVLVYCSVYRNLKSLLKLGAVLVLVGLCVLGAQIGRSSLELPLNTFIEKAQFAGTEAQTSVGERQDFIIGGAELSLKEPLLGFGPGSFSLVYPRIQETWLANAPHAHNWFVKIALERGWLAGGSLIIFWLLFLFAYIRQRKNLSEASHFAMMAVAVAIGHNLIDFNFNFVFNFVVLMMLAALVLSDQLQKREAWFTRSVLPVVIVFFVLILIVVGRFVVPFEKAESLEGAEALIAYQEIEPWFFADELYLREASLAEQQNDYETAIKVVQSHLILNPLDAAVWNRLGDYHWLQSEHELALRAFTKALELDGKNNWSYYYNRLNALRVLGRIDEIREESSVVLSELEQYVPLAEANVHYTAESPNLKNAILTAEALVPYEIGVGEVLQQLRKVDF